MRKAIIAIIILLIIAWIAVTILNRKPQVENTTNIPNINNTNGDKIVASKGIEKEKIVGKLVITGGSLSTTTGVTTLKATVTNKSTDSSNIKLRVSIYDASGLVIFTGEKDMGLFTSGQIKPLNMKIDKEIKNAFNVEYEIQK
jgi:uncharacterized protein YcfL